MRVNKLKITQKEINYGRHIKFVVSASLLALAECSTWELGCQKAQAAREEVLEVCSAQTRAEGRNEEEAVRCIPDFASLPSFLPQLRQNGLETIFPAAALINKLFIVRKCLGQRLNVIQS